MILLGLSIMATIATMATMAGSASAQFSQWSPTKPIRMLLAYPPGAANDTNARAVAAKLTDNLKQQVIVDNRPGANGIVATTTLSRAAPDGHTLWQSMWRTPQTPRSTTKSPTTRLRILKPSAWWRDCR